MKPGDAKSSTYIYSSKEKKYRKLKIGDIVTISKN